MEYGNNGLRILTAQVAALGLALREAGGPRVVRQLAPGVALCGGGARPERPIFLRHQCPAEIEARLSGSPDDVQALVRAASPLLARLCPAEAFSVQTRILEGYQPAYKPFDIGTAIAAAAEGTGAVLNVKRPARVLSVTLTQGVGWLGLSTAAENLSDWAGGARRFKREPEQVSRAEFKLLEALEAFAVETADGGRALDLGAAPGGWTRVLRRRGLYVTAVDPAALDPRIAKDRRVTHFHGTAQAYFKSPSPCDLIVNDMKMDSAESAALMVEGAHCLKPGGTALLTLKLPDDETQWLPRVAHAEAILSDAYRITGLRQLFHNRSEVTAYLTRL